MMKRKISTLITLVVVFLTAFSYGFLSDDNIFYVHVNAEDAVVEQSDILEEDVVSDESIVSEEAVVSDESIVSEEAVVSDASDLSDESKPPKKQYGSASTNNSAVLYEEKEEADWFTKLKKDFHNNFIKEDRWKLITNGLVSTLKITLVALIIGIAIGILIAAVRSTYDKNKESMKRKGGIGYYILSLFNGICKLYLTVIRGTPMVVQLLIMYFVIFASLDNGIVVAMISFGINSGAYVAEIFRGGIMSIDNGQFEAGRSLGFNYAQTMCYIILPQTFKVVLPSLCNEFIVLIKETSVAGYVGIMELTKAGETIRSRTFSAFMPLIAVALIYLMLVMILTKLVGVLERRLRKNER